jgi:hypothetical protein
MNAGQNRPWTTASSIPRTCRPAARSTPGPRRSPDRRSHRRLRPRPRCGCCSSPPTSRHRQERRRQCRLRPPPRCAPRLRQPEQPQGRGHAEPSQTGRRAGRPTGLDLLSTVGRGRPITSSTIPCQKVPGPTSEAIGSEVSRRTSSASAAAWSNGRRRPRPSRPCQLLISDKQNPGRSLRRRVLRHARTKWESVSSLHGHHHSLRRDVEELAPPCACGSPGHVVLAHVQPGGERLPSATP